MNNMGHGDMGDIGGEMNHTGTMAPGGGHDHHTMVSGNTMDMHSGHDMHSDHDMGNDHDMNMMMKMYFHCSNEATVLFRGWTVESAGAWVGTCIAIFLMALLYEGLKVFREYLLRKSVVNVRYQNTEIGSKDSTTVLTESHHAGESRLFSWAHFLQTGLHMIQITISYFLMLIFMTYNVYLCIPIILGAGAGYFAFGWKRSIIVDVNEHCH